MTQTRLNEYLELIDNAPWLRDEDECLNLYVKDSQGRTVHCFLTLRPVYCDRGHIQLNIDGELGLDAADSFPRYFFDFAEADKHCRDFLRWRLFKWSIYSQKLPLDECKLIANPLERARG